MSDEFVVACQLEERGQRIGRCGEQREEAGGGQLGLTVPGESETGGRKDRLKVS
jgi:hypothetical protein